jgi:hypothetical protein
MNDRIRKRFPRFAANLDRGLGRPLENVLAPATEDDITEIEARLGIPLPQSYKAFLRCTRGFWARGGTVQLNVFHPFFHEWPPFEELSETQKDHALRRGDWPPPSQGMLCFAEFWLEADGDQVLFYVSDGLVGGEYPVYYYSHEDSPPSVRRLADSFEQWLNEFL